LSKLNIVRWQPKSGEYMVPQCGIDFIGEIPTVNGYPNFYDYIRWLAEECAACLRIWVNGEIIWDYERGYQNNWINRNE
jgi:hypothetical protein